MLKTIRKTCESLKRAGMLETNPLCVYGVENIPEDAIPIVQVDSCVAKAVLTAAVDKSIPALYIDHDSLKGVCPGSITWLGFAKKPSSYIKYFVSTGHKNFREGTAEYLKASPELFEKFRESIGPINLPGKYLVVSSYENLEENTVKSLSESYSESLNVSLDPVIQSMLCFGNGQQIRNLCSLIHFRTGNPFQSVIGAFGPACATMITYPAHLAEKTPENAAFIGPIDPTGNSWFPTDYMVLGIPFNMARDMCKDLKDSFAEKRPEVAYPEKRDDIKPK